MSVNLNMRMSKKERLLKILWEITDITDITDDSPSGGDGGVAAMAVASREDDREMSKIRLAAVAAGSNQRSGLNDVSEISGWRIRAPLPAAMQ
jgi:hypothetical protein